MAVSAAAVDESTFIWNPNLIALSSAIALAGAWRGVVDRPAALVARWPPRDGDRRCSATSSGVALLPVVGALLVADVAAAGPGRASGGPGRRAGRARDRRPRATCRCSSTS